MTWTAEMEAEAERLVSLDTSTPFRWCDLLTEAMAEVRRLREALELSQAHIQAHGEICVERFDLMEAELSAQTEALRLAHGALVAILHDAAILPTPKSIPDPNGWREPMQTAVTALAAIRSAIKETSEP